MRIADIAPAAALLLVLAAPALADGNVTVSVDGAGLVRVIGDDAPNDVEVTPGPGADELTVFGLGSTLVNGAPGGVIASGARSLRLEGRAGNDFFDVVDVVVRDLRVRLDDGHDTLRLDNIVVQRRATVLGGFGRDRIVTAGASVFRRSLRVIAGDGRDDVQLRNVRVLGRVKLHGGRDDDDMVIHGSAFVRYARVKVIGGAGHDHILALSTLFDQEVALHGGRDDDLLHVDDCGFADDVDIDGGRDDDDVVVRSSDFEDETELDGGSGYDDLDLGGYLYFARGRDAGLFVYGFEHRH